jgi:hypothetical protein
MLAYIDDNGDPQPWNPSIPVDGIHHGASIEDYWTDDQLTAAGLYPVILFVPPAGQMVVSGSTATYELNGPPRTSGTKAVQTYPTQAIPAPILPVQARNDHDAAAAGVPVGGIYCNGSQMMMRQS